MITPPPQSRRRFARFVIVGHFIGGGQSPGNYSDGGISGGTDMNIFVPPNGFWGLEMIYIYIYIFKKTFRFEKILQIPLKCLLREENGL